jgi:cobalt-zinc-cadmium efflux system protein
MSEKHDHSASSRKNLLAATILNFIISIAEVIGGIISGSLALLSDAIHNLGDAFSTFIAWIANIIASRESTPKRTFGYKRIEILAALLNSVILIGITLFLFVEAAERLQNPREINSRVMLIVAAIGLVANIIAVFLLHKDARHSLNVKAAYVHLIGDSLSSVVVIIGGFLILFFDIFWVDPVITFFIGIYIFYEAVKILNESVKILMQNTPTYLNIQEVKDVIEKDYRVRNIHHIHAWSLTDQKTYFEAHVDILEDLKISEINIIRKDIEKLLKEKFDIDHTTLQFEFKACDDELIKYKD